MVGEDALVIETNEILKIDRIVKTFNMKFEFVLNDDSKIKTNESFTKEYKKNKGDFILSNGKSYKKRQLIIGQKNIREYKLKNLLN